MQKYHLCQLSQKLFFINTLKSKPSFSPHPVPSPHPTPLFPQAQGVRFKKFSRRGRAGLGAELEAAWGGGSLFPLARCAPIPQARTPPECALARAGTLTDSPPRFLTWAAPVPQPGVRYPPPPTSGRDPRLHSLSSRPFSRPRGR